MSSITLSIDETHHIINNTPLYSKRFDKIQNFHSPPNYAPVELKKLAFFINKTGAQVFNRTFNKAFGFYEGIATVSDKLGFFHIDKTGKDIHTLRFEWSGNFQEGRCVVQDPITKNFYHININAKKAYSEEYNYVGDYKYGIAVVINKEGLSTHINKNGKLIHGQLFLELDVYHKGYAIAKDEQGYFHVDKQGKHIYSNRYLKLEPFYNERAVAVDHNMIKTLISSTGQCLQIIENEVISSLKVKKL